MAVGFNHPKVTVHVGDGFAFLDKYKNTFDVIITDSSDPEGPAESLFQKPYFQLLFDALRPGGVITTQGCMNPFGVLVFCKKKKQEKIKERKKKEKSVPQALNLPAGLKLLSCKVQRLALLTWSFARCSVLRASCVFFFLRVVSEPVRRSVFLSMIAFLSFVWGPAYSDFLHLLGFSLHRHIHC